MMFKGKREKGKGKKRIRSLSFLLFPFTFLLFLVACGSDEPQIVVVTATPEPVPPTVAPLPSVYPTFTPESAFETTTGEELLAVTATPVLPTATAVDFTQPALSLRLSIPALGLDRTLAGSLSSAMTLRDEATGQEIVFPDQGAYLVQIEAVLNGLLLEELPVGCDRCLHFSYALPFDGQEGEGWLRDPIVIASLERLFTEHLGPHFPEDTIVGINRQISGYTIAHTAVVRSDGAIWRWNGPDDMAAEPELLTSDLQDGLNNLTLENGLARAYLAECPFYPLETIAVVEVRIETQCPPLSLPTTLVPVYALLNQLTAVQLADERNLPYPEQPLPLDGLIYYERIDGASVTIYGDGRFVILTADGEPNEGQIPAAEVGPFVAQIVESDLVPVGVSLVLQEEIENQQGDVVVETDEREYQEVILVRSEAGVHEFGWSDNIGQGLIPAITILDVLIADRIGLPEPAELEAGDE